MDDARELWLLLMHQLPPKPTNLRVKVWRRLQALGAVPIKNSVYAMPCTDDAREDLEWLLREIKAEGGDASLCEARLVDGLTDDEVRALFVQAREADYRALAADLRAFARDTVPSRARTLSDGVRAQLEAGLTRFRKRLADIGTIDFFAAAGRQGAEALVSGLEERLAPPQSTRRTTRSARWSVGDVRGRTWVTRQGVHIDRIACAWLIRRFIDPEAAFRFVPPRGHVAGAGELRFDMFEAEFTHDGDLCSFEVLLRDFALDDPTLRAIAEIVHDIDLKDAKYDREETRGVEHLIAGLAWTHTDDTSRVTHGATLFDALYAYTQRRTKRR